MAPHGRRGGSTGSLWWLGTLSTFHHDVFDLENNHGATLEFGFNSMSISCALELGDGLAWANYRSLLWSLWFYLEG